MYQDDHYIIRLGRLEIDLDPASEMVSEGPCCLLMAREWPTADWSLELPVASFDRSLIRMLGHIRSCHF